MTKYQIGNRYHGFLLERTEEIADISSVGHFFLHEKTGARLFYVQNTDDNQVFFISFLTPPTDDCGTPHILEHSVLCGSERFQAKDPFNELAKGSLHTYLNALTYADKTMYPVASRNRKDFHNMMEVYLDAVFFPKIYEHPEIFWQEGWRYELANEDAPLTVTGVVYNEMKGAFSDPEGMLGGVIARSLFPDSVYGYESGGDPQAIPDLQHADFLQFHKTCYHPANSFLYLYGDVDLEGALSLLNDEYLSRFEKGEALPPIPLAASFSAPATRHETYPASTDMSKEKADFLAYNVRILRADDPEKSMAISLLTDILLNSNASFLKKQLLDTKLVSDIEGWFDSSTLEMVFSIIGKDAKKEDLEAFCDSIETALTELVKTGIDPALIASVFHRWEFALREEDYGQRPKGLVYGMKLMKSWLHGKNPAEPLFFWKHLNALKEKAREGYFETLIQTELLENKNKSFVTLSAEQGKQSRLDEALSLELAQKKEQMSEAEIHQIIENNAALLAYQTAEESEDVRRQIPTLAIHEIDTKTKEVFAKRIDAGPYSLVHTEIETNGILYLQLLFDTAFVPEHLLPYAGTLLRLLSKLDTAKHSYQSLPIAIDSHSGGIFVAAAGYSPSATAHTTFAAIHAKALLTELPTVFSLLEEVLCTTDFSQLDNSRRLLLASQLQLEGGLQNEAHMAAISASLRNLFAGSSVKAQLGGVSFLPFLTELVANLDLDTAEKLRETASYLFTRKSLTVATGCQEAELREVLPYLQSLYEALPEGDTPVRQNVFVPTSRQIAFTTAGKVQYHALSGDFVAKGHEYSGTLAVLRTLLNREHLWNRVRIQGGAYGAGCQFQPNGAAYMYSYRDPNMQETFQAYQDILSFVECFQADTTDMTKHILGAINALDRPQSSADKMDSALSHFFLGRTQDDLQKERDQVLATTAADIRAQLPLLQSVISTNNLCSIGNEDAIRRHAAKYQEIRPLLP